MDSDHVEEGRHPRHGRSSYGQRRRPSDASRNGSAARPRHREARRSPDSQPSSPSTRRVAHYDHSDEDAYPEPRRAGVKRRHADYDDDDEEEEEDGSGPGEDDGPGDDEAMDVDDEIDELLSEDEAADDAGNDDEDEEGGGGHSKLDGERECLWEDCNQMLSNQADLVQHIHEVHIGTGRQPYACVWEGCPRYGQKQASRHALLTHMRSHTGEKPYACPEPGCGRTFTRSDAMNKHMKSIHVPGGPPVRRRRGDDSIMFEGDEATNADRDLVKDEDLAEVVVRLRSRDRVNYLPANEEEQAALRFIRDSRPGGAPAKSRRGRRHGAASDSDEFDEGTGKRYPIERTVESYTLDQADNEVPIMSRSRWQAKYVMAKAKLMLVDEENKMRRDELLYWEAEERRLFGGGAPPSSQHEEPEAEPTPIVPPTKGRKRESGKERRPPKESRDRKSAQHDQRLERRPKHEEPDLDQELELELERAERVPKPRERRGGRTSSSRRGRGRNSNAHPDPAPEPDLDDELYEAAMG